MGIRPKDNLGRVLDQLPRKLQNGMVAMFAQQAPGRFASMIEVERLRQLFDFLRVDLVFDIGANEGQYAQQLRKMVGYTGQIISFEPTPSLAERLRDLSSGDPMWTVEEVAVGSDRGTAPFNIMASSQMNSMAKPTTQDTDALKAINTTTDTIEVATVPLKDLSKKYLGTDKAQRPFLKMDTQGYDMQIARASQDVLREFVGIQTELSIKKLYESSEFIGDSISYFRDRGFELSALVPNNAGHFPLLVEIDGIFVRDDLV